jgi:hypothetical protein
MSANHVDVTAVLNARYRCAEEYDVFRVRANLTSGPSFFKFGNDAVCYGRTSEGRAGNAACDLHDASRDIVCDGRNILLSFDPGEVIENIRCERYMHSQASSPSNVIQKIYYTFRPLMPVGFRKHLQRLYLNRWRQIPFPRWPVDRTVEELFERLVVLSMEFRQVQRMPFVWFWPQGCSGCLMITHDIETAAGRDRCVELAGIDASFGMKSSFQIVPVGSYEVPQSFLESLRDCGSEINLHGLRHDGQLFRDRDHFLRDVQDISRYAREYGATGFRSPVLYRNLAWYDAFDFAYDMSVPNCAHLDPQRGGCCTVLPYFVGNVLELPLTTTQDYTLFNILAERSIDLWKQQIDLVLEKHGLLSFNIHPDYIMTEPYRGLYMQLLQHLQRICAERNIWIALPGEVDRWWRQRHAMCVAHDQHSIQIQGPDSNRAVLAYARSAGGLIIYDIGKPEQKQAGAVTASAG